MDKQTNGSKRTNLKNTLIETYGLYWKAEDVFWGRPNSPGNLFGIQVNAKTSNPVDFRQQTGIYILYADYKIVYIGQAGNGNSKLFDRLKKHYNGDLAGRWNQFSWFGLQRVLSTGKGLSISTESFHPSKGALLNHIEAILIHTAEPPLNRQGGKWGKAKQYLQYRDEDNLGKSENEMLRDIFKKIQK